LYICIYVEVTKGLCFVIVKQEFPVDGQKDEVVKWFEDFVLWLDLGYLGAREAYEADEVKMPHKKSRVSRRTIRLRL